MVESLWADLVLAGMAFTAVGDLTLKQALALSSVLVRRKNEMNLDFLYLIRNAVWAEDKDLKKLSRAMKDG